jgi:hypothetical protein
MGIGIWGVGVMGSRLNEKQKDSQPTQVLEVVVALE